MTKFVQTQEELIRSLIENLHAATFYYNDVTNWAEQRDLFKWWEFNKRREHDILFIKNMIHLNKEIKVIEIPVIIGTEEDVIPIVKSAHLFKD